MLRQYRECLGTLGLALVLFALCFVPGVPERVSFAAAVAYFAAMGWAIWSAVRAKPPVGRHLLIVWLFTVLPLGLFAWSWYLTLTEGDLAIEMVFWFAVPTALAVLPCLFATAVILTRSERLKTWAVPPQS